MPNKNLRTACRALAAACILLATIGNARANLIIDFTFTDSSTGDGPIVGQIFGLVENGIDQQSSQVVITDAPFMDAIGTYTPSTGVNSFNSFSLAGGILQTMDFVGDIASGFRLDLLGDLNDSGVGNRAIFTQLGGSGITITGNQAIQNIFAVSPPNPVPSPAPLSLLGAGLLAYFGSRKLLK